MVKIKLSKKNKILWFCLRLSTDQCQKCTNRFITVVGVGEGSLCSSGYPPPKTLTGAVLTHLVSNRLVPHGKGNCPRKPDQHWFIYIRENETLVHDTLVVTYQWREKFVKPILE